MPVPPSPSAATRPAPSSTRRRATRAALLGGLLPGLLAAFTPGACAAPKFEDTIAQRVLACTGCHGPQGRAATDGYYPRIAGKPPVYLYNQLLNFRDGRRHYALMTGLITPLGDAYLLEIAGYFAGLDIPDLPPQRPSESAAVIEQGRRLVMQGDAARRIPACVQCHGEAMAGVSPSIPGLLGLPRDYLIAQLGAWRSGDRRAHAPDCMAQVAKALTTQDIGAVSAWLAAQPAHAKPAATLSAPLPLDCGGVVVGAYPQVAPR